MKIRLDGGLPYVSAILAYNDHTLQLPNLVLDTGSVGTILSADKVAEIGLLYGKTTRSIRFAESEGLRQYSTRM